MTAATFDETIWAPKRQVTLHAARRRSRFIGALRRLFVAGAGASFAAVFVFMGLYAIEGGYSEAQYSASEPLRMMNPRFIGRSKGDESYQLTAEMAERPPGENQPVALWGPVYRSEKGTIMSAHQGVYDEVAQTVEFDGRRDWDGDGQADGVLFADLGGNRFVTPHMTIDLEQGALIGRGGVTGAGPLGVIEAETYELRDSDRALVLRGRVRGQIPDRNQQSGEPAP